MMTTKTKVDRIAFTMRLPVDILLEIDQRASVTVQSRTQQIEFLLREALNRRCQPLPFIASPADPSAD